MKMVYHPRLNDFWWQGNGFVTTLNFLLGDLIALNEMNAVVDGTAIGLAGRWSVMLVRERVSEFGWLSLWPTWLLVTLSRGWDNAWRKLADLNFKAWIVTESILGEVPAFWIRAHFLISPLRPRGLGCQIKLLRPWPATDLALSCERLLNRSRLNT